MLQSINQTAKSQELGYLENRQTALDAAFVLAVEQGSPEKIEELLQAGADVNTPIPYTWTEGDCDRHIESSALIYAIRHNRLGKVEVLVKVKEQLSETLDEALDCAIRRGNSYIVEELLQAGADVNCVDDYKNTPLISAISGCGGGQKVIQALLKAGANVTHVNKYGRTALMEAVNEYDINTVKSLLEIPAMHTGSFFGFGTQPINYVDEDGNTALMLAIKGARYTYISSQEHDICLNSEKIARMLLQTPGIDLHHVNKNGETAITLLAELKKKMDRYRY